MRTTVIILALVLALAVGYMVPRGPALHAQEACPTATPAPTATPVPPTPTPAGGTWQYSSIFLTQPNGWYSGRDTNHDLAAFATPFVFPNGARVTGIRIDLLASPTSPCPVDLALYSNQIVDGNNAPYQLLWQGQVSGDVTGVFDLSLDITVGPGIIHAVWATACALPVGVLGNANAANFASINANGRNEYYWSYSGTMPAQIQYRSWLYGWGAYFLALRVE